MKNRQYNGQNKKYTNRSTKHTHKTKDQVTQTPLKTGGKLRCFKHKIIHTIHITKDIYNSSFVFVVPMTAYPSEAPEFTPCF
jgi:hypothetical protein